MKLILLTQDQKWDEENEIEIIKCPICHKQWYSEGEYSECSHLVFVVCTYDFAEFLYISNSYKNNHIVNKLEKLIVDYQNLLEENDYEMENTIEDTLLGALRETDTSGNYHCLVDEYLPEPPETSYFITLFGYKK